MDTKKIDTNTPLGQIEAGRCRTILYRDRKVRLTYAQLNALSPEDIAKLDVCISNKISAEAIAKAAGRSQKE